MARRAAAADRRDALEDRRAAAGERDQAVLDRSASLADRGAGAGERTRAELDRSTSLADRGAGASERSQAELDRSTALADRGAGATERTHAGLDRSTSFADRGAGATERTHAGLDRSTSLADRGAGASERTHAGLDRSTSFADRGASAREREYASVDGLTGVHRRAPGFVELGREISRARRTEQPLVVAFVDVDRLKAINDSHGHAAGDRMLLLVANTLRAQLRAHDLIIRYGGDEFVCVLAGLTMADATTRLACVNAALAEAPEPGSVTVGLAELQPDDLPEALVARADAALYLERRQRRRDRN